MELVWLPDGNFLLKKIEVWVRNINLLQMDVDLLEAEMNLLELEIGLLGQMGAMNDIS